MSIKLKGKELDIFIEKELLSMLDEGYEHSPITQSNLAKRLIAKKVISYKSTLTKRKELIDKFAREQQDALGGSLARTLKNTRSMTRKDLESTNAKLNQQVMEAKNMVKKNTQCVVNMMKTIRMQTKVVNIERCLSPYLIRELHNIESGSYEDELF